MAKKSGSNLNNHMIVLKISEDDHKTTYLKSCRHRLDWRSNTLTVGEVEECPSMLHAFNYTKMDTADDIVIGLKQQYPLARVVSY